MYKYFLCIINLIILTGLSYSQSGWWVSYPAYWTLYDIKMVNQSTGFCAGTSGTILKTTNSGDSWVRLNTGVPTDLFTVSFINETTGWAAGGLFAGSSGTLCVLIKTTNGGDNWSTISNTYLNSGYYIVNFINAFTGFLLTKNLNTSNYQSSGSVNVTTNGGLNWSNVSPVSADYLSLTMTPNGTALITCRYQNGVQNDTGYIFKSTDNGLSWLMLNKQAGSYFVKSCFVNDNIGWFVGSNVLFKTSNGGQNFTSQIIQQAPNMMSVFMLNEQTGWISTFLNEIYRTTNGGSNWNYQSIPGGNANSVRSIYFFNQDTGIAAGMEAIKTVSGGVYVIGIEKEGLEVPSVFSLSQNYPNPFNPTTNINFALPKDGNATLKIYDAIGNEVATYLDGYIRAGSYNAEIDASNWASGIYFYTLRTADFFETKKMMLIK